MGDSDGQYSARTRRGIPRHGGPDPRVEDQRQPLRPAGRGVSRGNRQIHRIETRVEPASEDVEEEFKRRRVRLKDEIAQMLEGSDVTYSEASPVRAEPAASSRLRGGF
jgi:hypothetical protein